WDSLYVDIRDAFGPLEFALDHARLRGVSAKVFNIPLCHLPAEFRDYAVASISDWKRRYSEACSNCCEQERCSGFFEWHPKELIDDVSPL
ncbi:MAG: His-Xaa-Ser system radical SAM maturase HxsC, partial [Novosphingobium sp.]|nr:His-Xaa-Ser system radical SAM maturase HxsC [Novosphingobium sp.]